MSDDTAVSTAATAPGPTHRCPTCALPYWIERTCTGRFDYRTGEFLQHTEVVAVPIDHG